MIVIDLEGTGLDVSRCSILSIGAVDFENPENTFYEECRAFEGADIWEEAVEMTGFSRERIQDPSLPTPDIILMHYIEWSNKVGNRTLAGNSLSWDQFMIENEVKRSNIKHKFGYRLVDLHAVVYMHHLQNNVPIPLKDGYSRLGLTYTLPYIGINYKRDTHNALEDAKLTAECFSRILYGKNLLKEYAEYPIPDYLTTE